MKGKLKLIKASGKPRTLGSAHEDGNLIILGLGLWVFVLSLVFIVASALNLHNERRNLLAETDAIALAVADSISDEAYYGSFTYQYDERDLSQKARTILAASSLSDARVVAPTGVVDGTVVVTLELTHPLAFVPELTDVGPSIVISATSYASLEQLGDGVD